MKTPKIPVPCKMLAFNQDTGIMVLKAIDYQDLLEGKFSADDLSGYFIAPETFDDCAEEIAHSVAAHAVESVIETFRTDEAIEKQVEEITGKEAKDCSILADGAEKATITVNDENQPFEAEIISCSPEHPECWYKNEVGKKMIFLAVDSNPEVYVVYEDLMAPYPCARAVLRKDCKGVYDA